MSRMAALARDRGSYTVEVVVVAPVLILLTGLVMAWGIAGRADGAVATAARAAARAAALAPTAELAQQEGRDAALAVLDSHASQCTDIDVALDTGGFAVPVGEPASVTATVSCRVPLSKVTVPGMPGSRRLADEFTAALDVYAERGA